MGKRAKAVEASHRQGGASQRGEGPGHRASKKAGRTGLLVLGNQLFAPRLVKEAGADIVFMREDFELCTYFRFHHIKLAFYLAAMRAYADELRDAGIEVAYEPLKKSDSPFEAHLLAWAKKAKLKRLLLWDIEDAWFRDRMERATADSQLATETLESPLFLTSNEQFRRHLGNRKRPFMKTFYEAQRKRLGLLLTTDGEPEGGRWSFDADNRQSLPAHVELPGVPKVAAERHVVDVIKLVGEAFADHPGKGSLVADGSQASAKRRPFWLPTTRAGAARWLERFLTERFDQFGPYEDALSKRDDVLFHSVLSPMLNVGLLLPGEVIAATLKHAKRHKTPIASVEGFVRQIVGWREFIRGIDRNFGAEQAKRNHFGHRRKLSAAWYEGNSGIEPLDDVVQKVARLGWAHHIERLMVVGNLMLLCEIAPAEAYRWFMEMFVDSSDWVMGPNVYGMGIFSDGGIFATKPYICGANYLRKMGGYKKGPWVDMVDGLYWRFVTKHAKQFAGNPRLQMMVRAADRLSDARKKTIFSAADEAVGRLTR